MLGRMPRTAGPTAHVAPIRTSLAVRPGIVLAVRARGSSRGRSTPEVGLTFATGATGSCRTVLAGKPRVSSRRSPITTFARTFAAPRRL